MRRLCILLSALLLAGATVGCSEFDHGSPVAGCNCGEEGMTSGPEMIERGIMMGSSSMSSGGVMVSGSGQPTQFMGSAQKMPQSRPIVVEEPPTN